MVANLRGCHEPVPNNALQMDVSKASNTGVPVFYALPLFTTIGEVLRHRINLLLHTFWLRPYSIPVPAGGIGHHEVHYEATTDRYWVTSDEEIDFSPERQEDGLKSAA